MSELTFIKDNKQVTILDDGTTLVVVVDKCDQCFEWKPYAGGFTYRDESGEDLLWLCGQCRR